MTNIEFQRTGAGMEKIDFRKTLKDVYSPSARQFSLMRYLMTDGVGNPNTSRNYQNGLKLCMRSHTR